MKNKLKWVVSLAILLTLALLAFTGCEREDRKYDLKQVSIVTMSDAIEDVLASSVVVEAVDGQDIRYYCAGVAITEKLIIVPKQVIPLTEITNSVSIKVKLKGRTTSQTQRFDLELRRTFYDNNYGFVVLSVVDENIKLKPIKFASTNEQSNDIVGLAELIFGVEILIPDSNVYGTKTTTTASVPVSEYYSVIPVLVSSKQMMTGAYDIYSKLGLKNELIDSTFTTQGYFQKSDYDVFSNFLSVNKLHHGLQKISDSEDFTLTNCMLFNKAGEFVGVNYMRKVDNSPENEHVVSGIGYACRSDSIKKFLNSKGVVVA